MAAKPRDVLLWVCCGCGAQANWSGSRDRCGACGSQERREVMFAPREGDRLRDGRDVGISMSLAKTLHGAVPRRHLTRKVSQSGYEPAHFEIAWMEDDGTPSGRFATVTVSMRRDADLAERIRAERSPKRQGADSD